MGDNKAYVFLMLGLFGMFAAISIFGDSGFFDSESTKKFKETEKTKQIQYQWKIDSLKATQKTR